MSEKESILKKYTDLRKNLAEHLRHLYFLIDGVVLISRNDVYIISRNDVYIPSQYDIYINSIKDSIEELNESLSLDDNDFIEDLHNISSLVEGIEDEVITYLQGDFTQSFFESSYGKYIKDEQIDPVIRNKLKEIGNKVIENEKVPFIQRFNNALKNFKIKRDSLSDYIDSFIEEIDGKLIKYFLEHE